MAPDGILTEAERPKELSGPPSICPECGSPRFQRIPRTRIFLVIATLFVVTGAVADQQLLAMTALLAAAIGVMLTPGVRCTRCHHRWTAPRVRRNVEPPLPDPADMLERRCARCGSFEVYDGVMSQRCDACGFRMRRKK